MLRSLLPLITLTTSAIWPRPAVADFPGELPHGVMVEAAGTLALLDTSAGLGLRTGGLGTTVVFEDLLDLPVNNRVFRLAGSWHFGQHHNLDFGFTELNREHAREVNEDVQFGAYTFLARTRVTGKIDSRFIYVAYRHDLLRVEQVHIGATAGASIMSLGAALSAAAGVVDSTGELLRYDAEVGDSVTFPVPLLGLQLDWAVSRRGLIQYYGRFFFLNTGTLRGGMNDTSIRYMYFPLRHWGFSVGFDKIAINIPKFESSDYIVRASYTMQGFSAGVRFAF